MAIIGIDKNETYEFTSKFDSGDPKTVFLIGVLTKRERIDFLKQFQSKGDLDVSKMQEQSYEVLKKGLKGIKNLYNKKTKKHEDFNEITDDIIERLPIGVIGEVARKIIEENFMTEGEQKN